jgi:P4 family phage/plasmid primase-like protien
MEIEASKFLKLGYTSVGVVVSWDCDGAKKKIAFKQLWQHATKDTCSRFFKETDNGIAILTGEVNDLYVIDCDVPKQKDIDLGIQDGVETFKSLIEKHGGLPGDVPIQRSASGGVHYFFSLSKSLHNGLLSEKNQTKVPVNGSQTTIDSRGTKGCIIAAPTEYMAGDEPKKYQWIKPLVPVDKLHSLPSWCIDMLNLAANAVSNEVRSLTLYRNPEISKGKSKVMVFKYATRPLVENQFEAHFQHIYDREQGYDGSFLEKKPCALCNQTHRANNYMVRQIVEAVYYIKNYSTSCKSGAFNWESSILLNSVIETPNSDEPYARIFKEVMRSRGIEIVYTEGSGFLCFNGHYWEELHRLTVAQEIRSVCGKLLEMLYKNIHISPDNDQDSDAAKAEKQKLLQKVNKFKIGRSYIKRAGSVNSILECYKQMFFDPEIEKRLNTNNDILVVGNGVVDLRTGQLREGLESDYTTIMIDTTYEPAIATGDIDAFFSSIFNDDQELIEYVQRLLGYAITGHTSEQIWCIFTGEGSNGKSLLMSVIEKLMGRLYVTAPREIFFKNDRKTQAGAATAHLAALKGARICVKEEADPKDALNIEIIKIVSGESTITSRGLYEKSYTSFVPTALPILLCNHKPEFDVDDYAMLRRIVVIPFNNIYCSPHDPRMPYDACNPRHRLRDSNLRRKLVLDTSQQQLLTWLVRGAGKWFASGLGPQPESIKNALSDYYEENDRLGQFIDEQCDLGRDFHVNARVFRDAFAQYANARIQQKDLAEMMNKRGFQYVRLRTGDGKRDRIYKGLKLIMVQEL